MLCFRFVSCFSVEIRFFVFFFFNDTATTEIYTLSLHDALPISRRPGTPGACLRPPCLRPQRSEEHTSELQSPCNLVCRLLLEKKKSKKARPAISHPPQIHQPNASRSSSS